jgi:hypothetical protein
MREQKSSDSHQKKVQATKYWFVRTNLHFQYSSFHFFSHWDSKIAFQKNTFMIVIKH